MTPERDPYCFLAKHEDFHLHRRPKRLPRHKLRRCQKLVTVHYGSGIGTAYSPHPHFVMLRSLSYTVL